MIGFGDIHSIMELDILIVGGIEDGLQINGDGIITMVGIIGILGTVGSTVGTEVQTYRTILIEEEEELQLFIIET